MSRDGRIGGCRESEDSLTNAGSIAGTDNLISIVDPDTSAGTLPRRFYHVIMFN